MSASLPSSPRRHPQGWLLLAGLCAALAWARHTRAADSAVQIDCPELSREQAAEIESRVRASLLMTEGEATVAITCRSGSADVRVERAPETVVVTAPTPLASVRDEVLRAVDQALEELMRRLARAKEAAANATPAPVASPLPEPTPLPASPAPAPRAVTAAPPPASTAATDERAITEIFGAFVGESWSGQAALGGALGATRSTPQLWYGLCAALLRPASQAATFSAVEAQVAAELGVQPRFAAGIRLMLALGPSVLFIRPQGDLTSRNGTEKTSLFAALHVSRPVWFGRIGLLPALGVRLFTSERGVIIDDQEQLFLGGFVPQLSLGIAYRID